MATLAEWRATRDPRIGKAIVEAPVETGAFAAIDALPAKQQTAALTAALATSTDVGALVAAIDRFARTRKFAWPVVEQLADLEPDPRWAWLALTLLADFERLPPKSAKLWRRLVDAVEQHGDAAFGAALVALPLHPRESEQVATRIANVGKRLAKRTTVAVDDAALAIWRGALAARPTRESKAAAPADAARGDALLAAVYADPDDLGARAVYGDWLVAHADPRGEFIQLQLQRTAGTLTPAGARRETALLRKHARTWLWPLADKLGPSHPGPPRAPATELAVPESALAQTTFANGFVAQLQKCTLENAVLETPMVATVTRALGLRRFSSAMRALREARIDSATALATLGELPRPLQALAIGYFAAADAAALRGVPNLEIAVDHEGKRSWVEVVRDNPQLEALTVDYGLVTAWGEALEPDDLDGAPRLRAVVLRDTSHRTLTLTRPDATRWIEAAIDEQVPAPDRVAARVAAYAALARLGPDRGPLARLVWRARQDPGNGAAALRVALAPLARDVVVKIGWG